MPPLAPAQARDTFQDFVAATLLGPGADPDSGAAPEREQLGTLPLKQYYTGVLFPAPPPSDTPMAAVNTSDEDPDADIIQDQEKELTIGDSEEESDELDELTAPEDHDPQYRFERRGSEPGSPEYPAANQFFPANMGLTACVKDSIGEVWLDISFALYELLNPADPALAQRQLVSLPASAFAELVAAPGFPAEWGDVSEGLLRYEADQQLLGLRRALAGNRTAANRSGDFALLYAFKQTARGNYQLAALPALERLFFESVWERRLVQRTLHLPVREGTEKHALLNLDEALHQPKAALQAAVHTKIVRRGDCLYVKALLANESDYADPRRVGSRKELNELCFFQTALTLRVATNQVLSPHRDPAYRPFDAEAQTLDYLYRRVHSYGQGHSCAVHWPAGAGASVPAPTWLSTTWLPQVLVEGTSISLADREDVAAAAKQNADKVCTLRYLSIWETGPAADELLRAELHRFVGEYAAWHQRQATAAQAEQHQPAVEKILASQATTAQRLRANVDLLHDPRTMRCFRLANTAMLLQMVLSDDPRFGNEEKDPAQAGADPLDQALYQDLETFVQHPGRRTSSGPEPFRYRPFQLAFLLLNLRGVVEPAGAERREQVDLLWFPTGGGKTEAYLALTAFTVLWRRLAYPEQGGGVAVLMRYTLRLLTAQQFERAARLICALEFLRVKIGPAELGTERISLGMWVGGSTTPNKLKEALEVVETIRKQLHNRRLSEPLRLVEARKSNRFGLAACPWCGSRLIAASPDTGAAVSGFEASEAQRNRGFRAFCLNERCFFHGWQGQPSTIGLPIDVVDESLYHRPPTLLFATVDKYAQLAHRAEGGRLFGLRDQRTEGADQRPPDLIIQDELHLLNGPLGSVVGLFETAVELLATREGVAPKIVASTATTRNTDQQVAALYGGRRVAVFPPSGTDYADSFFARSVPGRRLHVGFLPTGKSGPDTQVRLLAGLLAQRARLLRQVHEQQPDWSQLVDNYWTLVVYFNNLRDLGKTSNQVSAEIGEYLRGLHRRFHLPEPGYGFAYRYLDQRTRELTSRVGSHEIKRTLDELKRRFPAVKPAYDPVTKTRTSRLETIDLVLASNMLSVGIDVERFNLMLMVGQPKNVAEYIQASSRVARQVAGLVVNLLNPSRAREKSYFENYVGFNQAYYRAVEPLTITPYTPVTLRKALNLVLLAWVRHRPQGLPGDKEAKDFTGAGVAELADFLARRIPPGPARAYAQDWLAGLEESWHTAIIQNPALKYQAELIKSPTDLSEWATLTSMREVDTTTVVQTNPYSSYQKRKPARP